MTSRRGIEDMFPSPADSVAYDTYVESRAEEIIHTLKPSITVTTTTLVKRAKQKGILRPVHNLDTDDYYYWLWYDEKALREALDKLRKGHLKK